jgi:hypothetical protein
LRRPLAGRESGWAAVAAVGQPPSGAGSPEKPDITGTCGARPPQMANLPQLTWP